MDSALLKKAIHLNQTGNRSEAREILTQIIAEEPENLTAWFWLVDTLESNQERLDVLHQAARHHAGHPQLQRAIKRFETELAAEQAPPPTEDTPLDTIDYSEEEEDILAEQSEFLPEESFTTDWSETESDISPAAIETDANKFSTEANEEIPAEPPSSEGEVLIDLRADAIENVKKEVRREKKQKKLTAVAQFIILIISIVLLFVIGAVWLQFKDQLLPNLSIQPTEATATTEVTSTQTFAYTETPTPEATQTELPTLTATSTQAVSGEETLPTATPLLAATITATPAVLEGIFIPLEGERFYDMAWSSNGTYLALAASSGLYLFDGRTYELIQHITVEPALPIRAITFSDDESLIAGGFDTTALNEDYVTRVKLWKVSDGAEVDTFNYNETRGDVDELALSLDNEILWMSAKYDQMIKWQVTDGILLDVYEFSASIVDYYEVAFAPDRRSFVTYSPYDRIRIYDSANGEQMVALGIEKDAVVVAYSPNSQYLASSYAEQPFLTIWDIPAQRELRTINTYTEEIHALSFNPFNRIVAAATSGDLIKFYDLNSGEELRVISRQVKNVNQMTFSPDDTRLALRNNKEVQIWGLLTDELIATFRLAP